MPKGPQGEKRRADLVSAAVEVKGVDRRRGGAALKAGVRGAGAKPNV
jgi:hypothetical protein